MSVVCTFAPLSISCNGILTATLGQVAAILVVSILPLVLVLLTAILKFRSGALVFRETFLLSSALFFTVSSILESLARFISWKEDSTLIALHLAAGSVALLSLVSLFVHIFIYLYTTIVTCVTKGLKISLLPLGIAYLCVIATSLVILIEINFIITKTSTSSNTTQIASIEGTSYLPAVVSILIASSLLFTITSLSITIITQSVLPQSKLTVGYDDNNRTGGGFTNANVYWFILAIFFQSITLALSFINSGFGVIIAKRIISLFAYAFFSLDQQLRVGKINLRTFQKRSISRPNAPRHINSTNDETSNPTSSLHQPTVSLGTLELPAIETSSLQISPTVLNFRSKSQRNSTNTKEFGDNLVDCNDTITSRNPKNNEKPPTLENLGKSPSSTTDLRRIPPRSTSFMRSFPSKLKNRGDGSQPPIEALSALQTMANNMESTTSIDRQLGKDLQAPKRPFVMREEGMCSSSGSDIEKSNGSVSDDSRQTSNPPIRQVPIQNAITVHIPYHERVQSLHGSFGTTWRDDGENVDINENDHVHHRRSTATFGDMSENSQRTSIPLPPTTTAGISKKTALTPAIPTITTTTAKSTTGAIAGPSVDPDKALVQNSQLQRSESNSFWANFVASMSDSKLLSHSKQHPPSIDDHRHGHRSSAEFPLPIVDPNNILTPQDSSSPKSQDQPLSSAKSSGTDIVDPTLPHPTQDSTRRESFPSVSERNSPSQVSPENTSSKCVSLWFEAGRGR